MKNRYLSNNKSCLVEFNSKLEHTGFIKKIKIKLVITVL